MKKGKPRDNLLLPLMKSRFSLRRDWIIDDIESLAVILKRYPALSRPVIVRLLITFSAQDNFFFLDRARNGLDHWEANQIKIH